MNESRRRPSRTNRILLGLAVAIVASAAATGCHARGDGKGTVGEKLVAFVTPKPLVLPSVPVVRLGDDVRRSSELVLGRVDDRPVAIVFDTDDGAILELDPTTGVLVSTTKISSAPAEGMLLGDGTLAVVLREEAAVAVFARYPNGERYREVRRYKSPDDPRALALSPDDKTLFVSTGTTHAVIALEPLGLAEKGRVAVPREPRGMTVTQDGETLVVAHASFDATTLVGIADLVAGKGERVLVPHGASSSCPPLPTGDDAEHPECKAELSRHGHVVLTATSDEGSHVLAPLVMVAPRPELAFRGITKIAPKERMPIAKPSSNAFLMKDDFAFESSFGGGGGGVTGYGMSADSGPPERFDVREIEVSDKRAGTIRPRGLGSSVRCLVPVAATFASAFDALLVACEGTKRVEVVGTTKVTNPRSLDVPDSPSAVVLASDGGRVLVWSRLAHSLSAHHLVHSPREDTTALRLDTIGGPAKAPRDPSIATTAFTTRLPRKVEREATWLAGRELFATTFDKRISTDGRACASCHVDGADDALVWTTPEGKRRTRTLEGQLGTGPFGWKGEHKTLAEHIKVTERQLGGTGLPEADRASLAAYVATLGARKRAPGGSDPLVAKGRELFVSQKHDCATCHAGGGADTDRAVHDVGTGGPFMTPSLSGVATRPLLFHDGAYRSLDELLAKSKSMGRANEMTPDERKAMGAFLATL